MTDLGHCDICRFEWCPDIPENVAEHRRRHREHMRFARPYRDKRLAPTDPWVTWESPRWKNRIVYEFARRFRRELRFDFPPWAGSPTELLRYMPKAHGYIFHDDGRALGACGFDWMEWSDAPACWTMGGVYVVPPTRRSGMLSRRWPTFLERFGEFQIYPPLSEAMKAFARKHATPAQLPHPSWLEPENA
jgi:hypothetical protein